MSIVCLTSTGYTTEEDVTRLEAKIKTLTQSDLAEKAFIGEHFCNSLKIGILLRRADFKTTKRLASCRRERWENH
jgi:hypothetical protein